MKKILPAFTLAEIMIVLTVVGVLTAILLPSAINSTPDENVMKFKKANSTLGTVIRELVNSDEYYGDGDLGKKPDGSWVVETDYFCNTFADVVSTKSSVCLANVAPTTSSLVERNLAEDWKQNGAISMEVDEYIDKICKERQSGNINIIVANDDISYFEIVPEYPFGASDPCGTGKYARNYYHLKWDREGIVPGVNYNNGFYYIYKPLCIDVDGLNKGEDPFGYGIRTDGKIFPGKRAKEWINKSIQNKE